MINQISLLPVLTGVMFVVVGIYNATSNVNVKRNAWVAPAVLSVVFACLSLQAVITDGPLGFWAEHTRNLWGNQIWYDLLLAGGVAWFFAAKKARSLGLRSWPWLLAVIATGSIGLLAFVARILYVQGVLTKTRSDESDLARIH